MPRRTRLVIVALLWVVAAWLIGAILLNPTKQADFRIYYRAATEFAQGLDPYVIEARTGYPFVYPPLTLHAFRALTALPVEAAQVVWLGLKLVGLAAFFYACSRAFTPLSALAPATIVYFGLGYNQAILLELRSGNAALLEQALVLVGLAFLVVGRTPLFVGALALAGALKLTPWLLLILPVAVGAARGWRWVGLGAALVGAYAALNGILYPKLVASFLTTTASLDDRGYLNPSSFAFIRDVLGWLAGTDHSAQNQLATLLYIVMVMLILVVSAAAVIRYRRLADPPDARLVVLFACVVYGLILPRFKNYSYVLLLVPALYVIRLKLMRRELPYPALFVFFSVLGYGPLFGNFLAWVAYLGELTRPISKPIADRG
ncbi:MAG: glycosyltransferase 87 family protein [Vicinamibacteraceae bacterium]